MVDLAGPVRSGSGRLGRALLGLAAALVLVAVLLTVQGLRRHPQHRVRLVAGPPAAAVDPAGCPIGDALPGRRQPLRRPCWGRSSGSFRTAGWPG